MQKNAQDTERNTNMEKINLYNILRMACVILLAGFGVSLAHDFISYDEMLTAMPFYGFVISRAVMFLIPCAIVAVIAFFVGKRK